MEFLHLEFKKLDGILSIPEKEVLNCKLCAVLSRREFHPNSNTKLFLSLAAKENKYLPAISGKIVAIFFTCLSNSDSAILDFFSLFD
jgi:hypothetical protein